MKNENLKSHEELNTIFFPAQVKKVGELFDKVGFASNLTHCVYLPEQEKVTQLCGSNYQLVSNEEIILPIHDKMLSIFGKRGFKTKVSSFDDRRFYVQFIVDGDIHNILKGDDVCPMIEIHNSYDGTIKQTIGIGYQRLICTNGLMAFREDVSVSVKHSKRSGRIELEPIYKRLENIEVKLNRFKKLSDRQVTPDEITQIMHTLRTSNTIRYPKKMLDSAKLIAEKEMLILDTPMNAWLLYNGFNYPLNHYETKLLPEEASKIDSRVLTTIEKTLALN